MLILSDQQVKQLIDHIESLLAILEDEKMMTEDNGKPETTPEIEIPIHTDPRHPNARAHLSENGLIKGVHLTVHGQPATPYRCHSVRVIDEIEAKGQTVTNVTQPDNKTVVMATGYSGNAHQFDEWIYHKPDQEIITDAKFNPPNLGPLAIFLTEDGKIISDVVASLGLPFNHHVSYTITFERRP